MTPSPAIGTLRESSLHAALKRRLAQPGDEVECRSGRHVIDIRRGELLLEIQTGNFSSIKGKLAELLAAGHSVRLIHPISTETMITTVDRHGVVLSRRRSPWRGRVADMFGELVSIPDLLLHPRFQLEVMLVTTEEIRVKARTGRGRRRPHARVKDRALRDVIRVERFASAEDYLRLFPGLKPDEFTTRDMAPMLGRPIYLAQQAAYCLRKAGIFEITGRKGRSIRYRSARTASAIESATAS